MWNRKHHGASIKLPALFVVIAGIPLVAFGWLGWRLLEQDRALENQRERERLENAASLLARELDRGLAAWENLLPAIVQGSPVALPPDAVALVFDASGVRQERGVRPAYYPLVPSLPEPPDGVFAAAEAQEFRDGNVAAAAEAYRRLASSKDSRVRAAALMRLARCLRKQQRTQRAVGVYGELAAMRDTAVAGAPSELVARRERIALFQMTGDPNAAAREETALGLALWGGQYRLDRATFDFYREAVPGHPPDGRALEFSKAIEGLWPVWQQQAAGRASAGAEGSALAAVWRRMPGGRAAIVGRVDTLIAAAGAVPRDFQVKVALEDPSGRAVWGAVFAGGLQVAKTFRETGLPWTLRVASADAAGAAQAALSRRNLLMTGFALMALVIAAASYFVFRAVNRELSVARLQSDFVATVSHEFRTPLTAMCHLTEMLEDGRTPPGRLPDYYHALVKETRRLRAMVESLLDFGRMEAGRRPYQMEETSATDLTREVVAEFCEHVSASARRIELQAPAAGNGANGFAIRADREAMALALRNLLDNAVKYSPESSTVRVSVESSGAHTSISVKDQGEGISAAEQRDIFRKFVRGTAARALNVKGTGIGLAIADHIVKAHGGRLEVESEPGQGSRFTIVLPAQASHA
jgi:signal transduction histidine kinase